jgi:hypothetical protein
MNALRPSTLCVLLIAAAAASGAESGDVPANAEAATSTEAAPAPSSDTPAAEAADELTDDEFKRVTKGFKRAKRGDEDYYCRLETPIGTRLGAKTCYTLAQLVDMERVRTLNQRKLEKMQKERTLEAN